MTCLLKSLAWTTVLRLRPPAPCVRKFVSLRGTSLRAPGPQNKTLLREFTNSFPPCPSHWLGRVPHRAAQGHTHASPDSGLQIVSGGQRHCRASPKTFLHAVFLYTHLIICKPPVYPATIALMSRTPQNTSRPASYVSEVFAGGFHQSSCTARRARAQDRLQRSHEDAEAHAVLFGSLRCSGK